MRILLHAPMHYEYSTELGSALAAEPAVSAVRLVVCDDFPYRDRSACPVEALYPDLSRIRGKRAKLMAHARALARVTALLRRWRPDVLHVQALRHAELDWPLLVAARALRLPVVWTAHNAMPHERRPHHRLLYRTIYALAERIIVHTRHTQAQLAPFGVARDKTEIIAHGNLRRMVGQVLPRERARAELGLAEDAFVLLFYGRLRPYKGLDLLLTAVERLADPRIVLLVAGEDLFNEWAAVKVPANVRMDLRRIDNTSTDRYFSAADLVVLPYRRIDQSGVLMLAMSYGCPVMASDVGGLGEVIVHDHTGFLLPPGDADALTAGIRRIADDPARLASVRDNAARVVVNEYGWQTIATQTTEIYEQLINGA